MHNNEYDSFGPWIDEIITEDDIPRLYRDYPLDLEQALLVLKVPRDIARRDATPAMHLYDALLAVRSEELTVLQRTDDTYSVLRVPIDSVFAIEDSAVLLDGRLTIHLVDRGPVTIRYNGSAQRTITRLTSLLRDLAGAATAGPGTAPAGSNTADDDVRAILTSEKDHGLLNDCRELLAREPDARFVSGYASQLVHPVGGGLVALAHRFRPAHLQGAIMLETPTSLIYTHRRDALVRGHAKDLSRATTVIFPDRVTSISTIPHPFYAGVDVVHVGTAASTMPFTIPTNAPWAGSSFVQRTPIAS
ncbi:MAG: hypothetical protein JWQ43_4135 [Glaciihabitans sp.]|nr:hypothetical protein [Glaciihabitans sp.]